MSDYDDRGAYTPPSDRLAFDPRQPVRGGGPAPVTLIVSGLVLACLVGGVFFLYRDGFKHSPAIIHFTTWEDAVTGGPLHTGAPLDLDMPNGLRVNLNRPAAIAKIIRYLKSTGWHPEVDRRKLEVQDGQMLLPRIFDAGQQAN